MKQDRLPERRLRRSGRLADALRLQLEVCREEEGLAAIVVSDEIGFCVAHAGGDGKHDELAARLPMLVDPALRRSAEVGDSDGDGDGALQPPDAALAVATFTIEGAKLYVCIVKGSRAGAGTTTHDQEVLDRVVSGFTRLLAD